MRAVPYTDRAAKREPLSARVTARGSAHQRERNPPLSTALIWQQLSDIAGPVHGQVAGRLRMPSAQSAREEPSTRVERGMVAEGSARAASSGRPPIRSRRAAGVRQTKDRFAPVALALDRIVVDAA